MRTIIIPALLAVACGGGSDDPTELETDDPPYIEACDATEVEGPDPVTEIAWTFADEGARYVETGDNGETWVWEFTPSRKMTSLTYTVAGSDSYTEQREYDGDDRLVTHVVDSDGAGEEPASTTGLIYEGDLVIETEVDIDSDQTIDSRITHLYDDAGNEIRREIDAGDDGSIDQVEDHTWDGDTLITSERDTDNDGTVDERTDFSYDGNGDLAGFEVVDAESVVLRTVTITRDARGNQIERIDRRSASDLEIVLTASFDEVDRMLTSGFSFAFGGDLFSTSDFSYRYECP